MASHYELVARSKLDIIDQIRQDLVNKKDVALFEGLCFGNIYRIKNMIHLHPMMNQDSADNVSSKKARFGPREFAIVIGLRFGSKSCIPSSSSLYDRYFGGFSRRILRSRSRVVQNEEEINKHNNEAIGARADAESRATSIVEVQKLIKLAKGMDERQRTLELMSRAIMNHFGIQMSGSGQT